MTPSQGILLPPTFDPRTHESRLVLAHELPREMRRQLPTDLRTHLHRRRPPSRRRQLGMISPALLGVIAARARAPSGGGGGSYYEPNLVMYLDAGNSSSFPGTGVTWANLATAPADGAAQSDYNWTRGTGPAFIGTAGGLSSGEYFQTSGTEFFSLALGTTSTAFLQGMHKTGAAYTIEMWIYIPSIAGGNVHPFFQSGVSDQGGSDNSRGIIYLDLGSLNNGGGKHQIRIRRDAGGASALAVASDAGLTTGSVCMYALSYDEGGTSFLYKNGAYDQVSGADTFTATLSSPGSSNPTLTPRMGTDQSASQKLPNGSRFYVARFYNAALSKANLDLNWDGLRGRFGM